MTDAELRARFEAGRYLQRAADGEFVCCLKDECIATSQDEPVGTRSVMVGDLDRSGYRIFLVHLYLRADGSIGASGREDPKWLYEDGSLYRSYRSPDSGQD